MKWTASTAAVLVILAGAAWGQHLPDSGEHFEQSKDRRNFDNDTCLAAGGNVTCALGYNVKTREFVPAPTPAVGAGSDCTWASCTRDSATQFTCSALGSITQVKVNTTVNAVVPSSPGVNQASTSTNVITFGYSIDAACTPPCVVRACGG